MKKNGFLKEFKEFAMRGNVIDMAIGVVIATAFGKITTSLVNDIFMPIIGYLIGGIDLSQFNIVLKPAVVDAAGEVTSAAVVIGVGTLLVTIINFIIIAFIVFMLIKGMNAMKRKEEVVEEV
ncbi:MAG: large conductance mechanosensitive channel protein MscL, partial [Erysipelotrichaceae bacterium]|nr:large conductance mechanosensitive channel protein MscL [Erysipelotrichaceae bacterium]